MKKFIKRYWKKILLIFVIGGLILLFYQKSKKEIVKDGIHKKSLNATHSWNQKKCKKKYCRGMNDKDCDDNEGYKECIERLRNHVNKELGQ